MLSFDFNKIVENGVRERRKRNIFRFLNGSKKRKNILALSGLVLLVVIAFASFKLGSFAAGETRISNYNFNYQGVTIHTKAVNLKDASGATTDRTGTATAKTGDIVQFVLTVNNPGAVREVDVKFTLPTGFTYNAGKSTPIPPDSETPPFANNTLIWTAYTAPAGDSAITLETIAP